MAPTTAGTNCLTQVEDAIVELIANCSAFQTWVGAASATAAKTSIYVHDVPQKATTDSRDYYTEAETAALFPLVLIASPIDGIMQTWRATALDSGFSGTVNSALSLRFEALATADVDEQNAARLFMNAVGNIIDEMRTRTSSGNEGEYQGTMVSAVEFYRYSDEMRTELGDVMGLLVDVSREITQ